MCCSAVEAHAHNDTALGQSLLKTTVI